MIKSCDLSKYISQNLLYNFEDALNIFIYLFIYLFIHLFIYLFNQHQPSGKKLQTDKLHYIS